MLGSLGGAEGDLRGPQQIGGVAHAIGDAAGDEALVVIQVAVGEIAARMVAQRAGGGVRVRAGNHHVRGGDARGLLDELARLHAHAPVQAEQVAHDEGQARRAIIQHQAAGKELVMHMRGGKREEATDDVGAEGRREVAGRRAGAKLFRLRRGGVSGGGEDAGEAKQPEPPAESFKWFHVAVVESGRDEAATPHEVEAVFPSGVSRRSSLRGGCWFSPVPS